MSGRLHATDRRIRRALIVADIVVVLLALALASLLRAAAGPLLGSPPFQPLPHIAASMVLFVATPLLLSLRGHYTPDTLAMGAQPGLVATAVLWVLFILMAVTLPWDAEGHVYSRSWLVLAGALQVAFLLAARHGARNVVDRIRARGGLRRRVLLVGTSARMVEIAQHTTFHPDTGVVVIGFLDEYLPVGRTVLAGLEVLGRPLDLLRGRFPNADEVVVDGYMIPPWILDELAGAAGRPGMPRIRQVLGRAELSRAGAPQVGHVLGPSVTLGPPGASETTLVRRRAFDFWCGSLLMVALAPAALLVLVAARVRRIRPLTSDSRVAGADGRPVVLRLVRHEATGFAPLRGWLALAPVVRGELSIVGPRPVPWRDDTPADQQGTGVRPGLTGAWRLALPGAPAAEADRRDLGYLSAYSMWADIQLVFATAVRLWPRSGLGIRRWAMDLVGTDLARDDASTAEPASGVARA